MEVVETSKGEVKLRDITLKDAREARSYANRKGTFNEEDYYSYLYMKISDKEEDFLNNLKQPDDVKLTETVKKMLIEASTGDAKKQL